MHTSISELDQAGTVLVVYSLPAPTAPITPPSGEPGTKLDSVASTASGNAARSSSQITSVQRSRRGKGAESDAGDVGGIEVGGEVGRHDLASRRSRLPGVFYDEIVCTLLASSTASLMYTSRQVLLFQRVATIHHTHIC